MDWILFFAFSVMMATLFALTFIFVSRKYRRSVLVSTTSGSEGCCGTNVKKTSCDSKLVDPYKENLIVVNNNNNDKGDVKLLESGVDNTHHTCSIVNLNAIDITTPANNVHQIDDPNIKTWMKPRKRHTAVKWTPSDHKSDDHKINDRDEYDQPLHARRRQVFECKKGPRTFLREYTVDDKNLPVII